MFEEYEDIMTVQEVCEALLVGKNTIYKLINETKLPCIKIGKVYKIRRSALEQYVKQSCNLP